VIYATHSTEYGAYLVGNTLRLYGFEILLSTDQGSGKTRNKTIEDFNSRKSGILVTNQIPDFNFDAVTDLIFFDASEPPVRERIIESCQDIDLLPKNNELTVHCLVAVIADSKEPTLDQLENELFLKEQDEIFNTWKTGYEISSKIHISKGIATIIQRGSPRR
jgi:hypothetical protein